MLNPETGEYEYADGSADGFSTSPLDELRPDEEEQRGRKDGGGADGGAGGGHGEASRRGAPTTTRGSRTTWSQKNKQAWEGRTTSPTGRAHPDATRRADLRKIDLHNSINYYATARISNTFASTGDPAYEAPDNDHKMKNAGFVNSQAWFESLRHYPKGHDAIDSEAAYSGLTHGPDVPTEHLETDVRTRLGIAAADPAWMPKQLQEAWAPETDKRLARKLAKQRARLTSRQRSSNSPARDEDRLEGAGGGSEGHGVGEEGGGSSGLLWF